MEVGHRLGDGYVEVRMEERRRLGGDQGWTALEIAGKP